MFGGELRDNDAWTLSLLTHEEVLDAHQNGLDARQVYRKDEHIVWTSHNEEGHVYASLFNAGDEASRVGVSVQDLGIEGQTSGRDIWNRVDLGTLEQELSADAPPHGAALFILK